MTLQEKATTTSPAAELQEVTISRTAPTELFSYGGPQASTEERIKAAIATQPVVVFGKTFCPFCLEVDDTFRKLGVPFVYFRLDQMPDGGAVHAQLKLMYMQKTVPYVFLSGEFVGGCDDTKKPQATGELDKKLLGLIPLAPGTVVSAAPPSAKLGDSDSCNAAAPPSMTGKPVSNGASGAASADHSAFAEGTLRAIPPLFWFPPIVDNHVVRLTGGFIAIIAIVGIVLRYHYGMWWAILGLWIDFMMRILGGGSFSVLSMIAKIPFARVPPELCAGAPKQAAAFGGFIMSGLAALFLFLDLGDKQATAAVLLVIFAFLASLEAVLSFCAGCWMFQLAVQWGLIPPTVYTIYCNTRTELDVAFADSIAHEELPPVQRKRRGYPGHAPTAIDLNYKFPRYDEHERQDFDIIRHTKIGFFSSALGMAGLAVMYKFAALPGVGLSIHPAWWTWMAVVGAVWFVALLIPYTLRALLHPQKIAKEWDCPLRANSFSTITLVLVLYAFLIYGEFNHSENFARVLFWAGAPLGLLLGFIRVGNWIYERKDQENINPAWLVPTVGVFVSALVAPGLDSNYIQAAYLWFAFAFIMWIMLFTITFHKAITDHHSDTRLRPLLWIRIACPAVAMSSYVVLQAASGGLAINANGAPVLDIWAKTLLFIALSIFFILLWGFAKGFFGRPRPWDMSADWVYAFPLEALAISLMLYQGDVQGRFTTGMAYAGLAVATVAVVLLVCHTLVTLLQGGIFRPENKWAPLSSNKLAHEAFRAWLPKWASAAQGLQTEEGVGAAASLPAFVEMWRTFKLIYGAHATGEDKVYFKAMEEWFPGCTADLAAGHMQEHKTLARWDGLVMDAQSGPLGGPRVAAAVAALRVEVPPFCTALLVHLREEEHHLQPIARKYFNVALQKQIVRELWDVTPVEQWAVILPWTINNLPKLNQRAKYIKTFLWAMPERCQLIGRMVALGVGPVQWERLAQMVPEMIPRGAPGWTRMY